MNFENIQKNIERFTGMKKQIQYQLSDKKIISDNLSKRIKLIDKSQIFLQQVAQETQRHLKYQIEDIVNLALETCFPDEYKFQLDFVISRGKTEADLVFISQKTNRRVDIMNASGGGVVDIASFALRISSYVLEQDVDNVIILDEPFRFLSKDLQNNAGQILQTLSRKLKIQFIIVSHIDNIIDYADKVFEIKKIDNVSRLINRGIKKEESN